MKSRCLFARLLCLFCLPLSTFASDAVIRLRNQTINPAVEERSRPATQAIANNIVSGLFLIQCTGEIQADWRDTLQAQNVELIRYIPDRAFLVKGNGADIQRVRSLPFVRWVGPYRANHKIHLRLQQAAASAAPVRVLLSPGATSRELALARTSFAVGRETTSSLGTILDGAATGAQIQHLAESTGVLWIEPSSQPRLFDEIAAKIVGGDDGTNATPTLTQQLGYNGAGVRVAVADSGLNTGTAEDMHPDLAGRVDRFFYYGDLTDAADEHSHGTHVTGIIAGNAATGEVDENGFLYGLGVASGAHVIAQRIFDGAGNYKAPPSYEALTHDAVRAGADIGSNSWGDDTQGRYDLSAAEFDALVRDADNGTPGDQPYILEFSAGNAGPGIQTVGSPAVAKNVIATGASQNDRTEFFIYADGIDAMADFSSRGPCEDGRIKPDVVAPGTWIASARSALADDNNAWAPISDNYLYQGGTSQAGPQVSGAAAVFVQYYRSNFAGLTPSPALVKAALINSAVDMDNDFGTDPVPNNDEGWGRVDLTQIIGSRRRFEFVDQSVLLTNRQTYEHRVVVASAAEPLKITLTYTDVPGFPAAIPALVNDLDLEVLAPDGRIYRGNQFDAGESVPNPAAADRVNNVEAVHLIAPLPGQYVIRVRATNVVEDARRDSAVLDQDFALVVSGDLPAPGVGVLYFDRPAYRAPDTIQVSLIDFDLSGQPAVTVQLSSGTETTPEPVQLMASGTAGIFTGSVATVSGAAAHDGTLQISHGDLIEARYNDLSPASLRMASARADLLPPVISNVTATNRFGNIVISWETDEPASSFVRYGTNSTFTLSRTNARLVQIHSVIITNAIAQRPYQFYVASSDAAGNSATNNNGGAYFTFVATPAATALLVDSYFYDESLESDPPIPASTYTDPLDQSGVSYELWDVNAIGRSPTAAEMTPFRVVLWRINDSVWSQGSSLNTLSPPQQAAITSYLQSGGSFFMASMEILSRLGVDNVFRTNILHVTSFAEDVGVPEVLGSANDPVTEGMDLTLDYSAYPDLSFIGLSQDLSDTIVISTNAASLFIETVSNQVAGVRFPRVGQDSANRVIFLPFPLDVVTTAEADPNNRANLLRNILSFLAPGVNGLGTIALDQAEYTLPSLVTIEVADSDLSGQRNLTTEVFSSFDTNGLPVVLSETVRPGLFRGFVTVVNATNAAAPGKLRANDGDRIWAEYFDASAGGVVRASATIDTRSPSISNVAAVPEYGEATITWNTSEGSDSLVEFGESTFLGRTAYLETAVDYHELTLTGLLPDQLYYYRVISRDAAGNAAIDDNNHRLYTFHTLLPITPPWSDNLESGSTNWTVLDGDLSESTWELGTPNNGRETVAHSPTNAWGCNLNGNIIDAAQTFLISPAFSLLPGSQPHLHFWHSYDFPDLSGDIGEIAQVYLSTNSGRAWIAIGDYAGANGGWEEETIDLTPYTGNVVRLGWYYEMLSFEGHDRPGWLIDDISITAIAPTTGQVRITNNLAEAHFNLSGPISANGSGWDTTVSNAPPGQYVVTFSPVPFYQTPTPQTNTLIAGSQILFPGIYRFADANTNGISDDWEQFHFGNVSPTRTQETDSDGDGASDYAEFMAGTDPANPGSLFQLTAPSILPGGNLQFTWMSAPDRAYQLQGSSNAITWSPVGNWTVGTGTNISETISRPPAGGPYLFRLEVRP